MSFASSRSLTEDAEKCFSSNILPYRLIKGEFDVIEPYFRSRPEQQNEEDEIPTTKRRRKNKKVTYTPSAADVETEKRHAELRPAIVECLAQLNSKWQESYKQTNSVSKNVSGNVASSTQIDTQTIDFPSIQEMVEAAHNKFNEACNDMEDADEYEFILDVTKDLDIFSVFNVVCVNKQDNTKLLQITPEATYLIPPKSTFLMGSIQSSTRALGNYVSKLGGSDLVVMDPPWPNKSVQRSSHYKTQDIYDLYSIPMHDLVTREKDTLVAIWVTNKPKFRRFVIEKLFPSWHLECVSEWTWLKVTTKAELIFPIDSRHKKTYEQLILGRPIKNEAASDCNNDLTTLPETHTIVSVPSVRHSRKPPLYDVIAPYLKEKDNPTCVELFARCLSPGWISWGNECLKFQHLNYFETDTQQL